MGALRSACLLTPPADPPTYLPPVTQQLSVSPQSKGQRGCLHPRAPWMPTVLVSSMPSLGSGLTQLTIGHTRVTAGMCPESPGRRPSQWQCPSREGQVTCLLWACSCPKGAREELTMLTMTANQGALVFAPSIVSRGAPLGTESSQVRPMRWGSLQFSLYRWETEAQRGEIPGPRFPRTRPGPQLRVLKTTKSPPARLGGRLVNSSVVQTHRAVFHFQYPQKATGPALRAGLWPRMVPSVEELL